MTDPHLIFDIRDGIAELTMNRPEKRNALSPEMLVRMAQAWRTVRDDDDIRVAVLTGAGDKAFCAGADLGRLITLMTRQRGPEDEWDQQLLADKAAFGDGHVFDPYGQAPPGQLCPGAAQDLLPHFIGPTAHGTARAVGMAGTLPCLGHAPTR